MTIRRFWEAFLAQEENPEDADKRFLESYRIGDSEADADEGLQLILAGTKTATSSLLWEYELSGARPPAKGDLSIVLDGRNRPACVVETIWVAIQPFAEADEQFVHDYGEWDRTLATWRKECWDYYSNLCADLGRTPNEDMPLVFERFNVVFRP